MFCKPEGSCSSVVYTLLTRSSCFPSSELDVALIICLSLLIIIASIAHYIHMTYNRYVNTIESKSKAVLNLTAMGMLKKNRFVYLLCILARRYGLLPWFPLQFNDQMILVVADNYLTLLPQCLTQFPLLSSYSLVQYCIKCLNTR